MKFEQYNLAPEIKESLAAMGFKRPTDIQFKAIPSILKGDDVMAIAQTGTGKTAAFAIPILHKLLQQEQRSRRPRFGVKCLVMVPTRELAIQIAEVFQSIAERTDLVVLALVGGVDQGPQVKMLEKGVDILIATPGRMFDQLHQGNLDLSGVQTLVLDEADHMLDLGFIKDIKDVIKHIPRQHQTLFFSATLNKDIKDLAYSVVNNPIRIQISPKDPVSKNVTHAVAYVGMDDKRFFLERLVKEFPESKILVFVRTKVRAERVVAAMDRVGIQAVAMHGGKEQDDRLKVMADFKAGNPKVLVTTDVNARGIDIPNVDYVVNYDLPDVPENYVHRVGRTGRGVQKGQAVSFCSEEEKPLLAEIQKFLGKEITEMKINKDDYRETISFSEDIPNDNWQLLIDQHNKEMEALKKKKKKKK
ncbi:ATP-dependent RNA helicase RhlE [Chitinophaga terrae (ex Kim and Jung 2007)]|uniref:ATP-dependent RNA helicase RhlE n=1 Tax=Chitinophaga terrae (ex Kim and Jung 2007) TaxID=408074 RepID=A0A1H4FG79_9BACT|nr:DEAD/DEAH box helicase [Chitinophaga terrae (ex Kim and Jung 2007)]MDQ0110172.1 ATP-dependent RNA helicase RhlE [Chitinophaga terrae (ex Kim and Jung 2007)]GEP92409.1 DEAD/DEAH box helicase [Chitinophaga terrae (ex Kim and Jung 2007)]SEA95482.1 ATP-dependent RNA helicase RhlE [Chitinophaga terrae (ex Kim and Jung 2007)]